MIIVTVPSVIVFKVGITSTTVLFIISTNLQVVMVFRTVRTGVATISVVTVLSISVVVDIGPIIEELV